MAPTERWRRAQRACRYSRPALYAGEPDYVSEGEPLPEGRATLGEEVIHHLETGEPLHPTLQVQHNLEAMAILDGDTSGCQRQDGAGGHADLVYWVAATVGEASC